MIFIYLSNLALITSLIIHWSLKNINNLYINMKNYLYKNNNRYKKYLLADKGHDSKKILKSLGILQLLITAKRYLRIQ
jgi:hypothetical protein